MSDAVIILTKSAIAHIKKQIVAADGNAFRLSIRRTGCNGYMYMPAVVSKPLPNDVALAFDDLQVYVDKAAVPKIRGTKIDFVEKDLGAAVLQYDNPKASGLCGCGESFNLDDDP